MKRCRFPQTCTALFYCLLLCFISPAAVIAAELPDKTFKLTITHGALPAQQRLLRVDKGDMVRLHLTSDTPGEIHLHGYRKEVTVNPGRAVELAFKAHATGRYRIEWHPVGNKPQKSDHHGQALATLVVQPR